MKALTIGGAMIDTIAIIGSDRIERMSMLNADSSFLLLEEGSKIEALEISTHVGGGAVNGCQCSSVMPPILSAVGERSGHGTNS